MAAEEEVVLEGGMVAAVVRVGDTVRRPIERWSAAAHGVLRHLEAHEFDGAPRLLGIDEKGREILTYIPGQPGTRPWPRELLRDDGLSKFAALLRRYHDAVRGYRPPTDTEWWTGRRELERGEVVLHGDPGPWNTLWVEGVPVAFVDFDFVAPGPPSRDVAYAAYFCVPMSDEQHCRECGFVEPPDRAHRLRVFCDSYGWEDSPEILVDVAIEYWRHEADQIESLGPQGVKPWAGFFERNLHVEDRQTVKWLSENRGIFT